MSVLKRPAVAVTLLRGLADLGQVSQATTVGWKVLGLVLGAVYTPASRSAVVA